MGRLREAPDRLLRIRMGFSDFRLPYAREDVQEVEDVFASLMDSVKMAGKTNMAKALVAEAIHYRRPAKVLLFPNHRERLRRMFGGSFK